MECQIERGHIAITANPTRTIEARTVHRGIASIHTLRRVRHNGQFRANTGRGGDRHRTRDHPQHIHHVRRCHREYNRRSVRGGVRDGIRDVPRTSHARTNAISAHAAIDVCTARTAEREDVWTSGGMCRIDIGVYDRHVPTVILLVGKKRRSCMISKERQKESLMIKGVWACGLSLLLLLLLLLIIVRKTCIF